MDEPESIWRIVADTLMDGLIVLALVVTFAVGIAAVTA